MVCYSGRQKLKKVDHCNSQMGGRNIWALEGMLRKG